MTNDSSVVLYVFVSSSSYPVTYLYLTCFPIARWDRKYYTTAFYCPSIFTLLNALFFVSNTHFFFELNVVNKLAYIDL